MSEEESYRRASELAAKMTNRGHNVLPPMPENWRTVEIPIGPNQRVCFGYWKDTTWTEMEFALAMLDYYFRHECLVAKPGATENTTEDGR